MPDKPREPYAKGQLIVWFKSKEITEEKAKEIAESSGSTLLKFHGPKRCVVGFDEAQVDDVIEKLWGQTEFVRNVSRNHYLYLC